MDRMNAREKLQLAYELAFHPARLNEIWNRVDRGQESNLEMLREIADWAAALHQGLPEAPAVSARALQRLAAYQATSRVFRMASAVRRFRAALGSQSPLPAEVPAWMVRDLPLPPLGREPRAALPRPATVAVRP
jgi:hypothetical protein